MSAPTPAALQTVLADLAEAWNAGDATAYAALFTSDASYVTFDGDRLEGRDAIEDIHRFLFQGPLRSSRMISESGIQATPLVREDVVVLVSTGGIQLPGQPDLEGRDSIQTLTLVRHEGRWLVAAFQNTRKQSGTPR